MKVEFNGKVWETDLDINENPIKLNLTRDGDTEGIWAYIDPKDRADYDSEVVDSEYSRLAIAANQTLNGVPYGAYIPYKLNGNTRPICIMEDCINFEKDPIAWSPTGAQECLKYYMGTPPEANKGQEDALRTISKWIPDYDSTELEAFLAKIPK